ncbi:unnamed protein product [Mucor fragilis]
MAKDKVQKKSPKKMSPYNQFMKTELAKVKKANDGIAHKDAQNWSKAPENPKNKKEEKKEEKAAEATEEK